MRTGAVEDRPMARTYRCMPFRENELRRIEAGVIHDAIDDVECERSIN
jgi:hypothetical protein